MTRLKESPESVPVEAAKEPILASLPPLEGMVSIPNQFIDFLYPQLDAAEQAVHLQLYRLSWGSNNPTCIIGLPKLAQRAGLSSSATQRAINRLLEKELIEKIRVVLGKGQDQGAEYQVLLPSGLNPPESPVKTTSLVKMTSLGLHDHDHDDIDKDHDHDDFVPAPIKVIYQTLTGKTWSKQDSTNFRKIRTLEEGTIIDFMRAIHGRTSKPIGSFAYFAKAILAEQETPPEISRAALRKKIQNIVQEIATLHVGGKPLPVSDLAFETKMRCLREGILWNDDVFNEVINTPK